MKSVRRLFSIFLVVSICISLFAGCDKKSTGDWKIGIITGTVSQNEEEYRAAQTTKQKFIDEYGEDKVILQTYPEKFMDEQETVIANIAGIAADPKVKALVVCQGVPGTSAAIDKVLETRDDLLIIVGTSGEDPNMIADRADVCFQMDELGMGTAVIDQAKKQGAETFVHYSFPRHMSYALLAARRDLFKENCEKYGIKFVDATAPDPTGDAGPSGAQQFIIEDVPKKVQQYGEDTAFFSTNCAMQPPLIKSVFQQHAIYPQPCCPSPYHGFPAALEIEIPEDKKGDTGYVIDEIRRINAENDMTGRMSTWPVPVNMMFIEAGAQYAKQWIEGKFKEKINEEKIKECFTDYAKTDDGEEIAINISLLEENGKQFDNYFLVLIDFIDL
ncbi:hypothetical protein SH1V18_17710 [Vallitalea longa]|uniref:DUF3798 domain-containing protein n=1 Tax=Vallitalea longa TaxID=2936439 RepID=A0A9W5YB75_9FIRM|nr:DUF3798 domain-containing protein [Vallitalea longa]GKX29291.1 hypothetical protein SH1V18_17710 [Vallitalea longa]